MIVMDMLIYVPNEALVKVGRATQAANLNVIAPFLDTGVTDFAWRLPMNMKLRDDKTKWLLRQLAYKHIPQSLLDTPKQGFGIPVGVWMRGPLRDWAESLLDIKKIEQQGFLNAQYVQQMWQEHLSGRRDWTNQLWSVMVFQLWLNTQ